MLLIFILLNIFILNFKTFGLENNKSLKNLECNNVLKKNNNSNLKKSFRYSIFLKAYNNFEQKKYTECKYLIENFILNSYFKDDIYIYSLFYYSLSCYYQENLDNSYYIFRTIVKYHPSWEKINEVFYWLSAISFKKGKYIEALKYINFEALPSKFKKLKKFYLEKLDDLEIFIKLIEKFPNDQDTLKGFAKFLINNKNLDLKKGNLKKIIKKYKIPVKAYDALKNTKSYKKKNYNVAVLLPFLVEEQDIGDIQNKFIYEFYKGIKLALQNLKKNNILINIYSYDTENDPKIIEEIFLKDEMKQMDLIIGPLFPKEFEIAQKFALDYKINIVNPFLTDDKHILGNPYIFLFNSGINTIAYKASELIYHKLDSNKNKNIGVICSDSYEDIRHMEIFTKFLKIFTKKQIKKIILKGDKTKDYLNYFRRPKNYNKLSNEEKQDIEEKKKVIDDVDILYISSMNKLLVSNIFSILKIRNINPQIVGHRHWLKYSVINFDILSKYEIFFLSPGYLEKNDLYYKNFFAEYLNLYKEIPSDFSLIGYQIIDFFGKQLFNKGVYFQKNFEKLEFPKNILFYGRFQDNQYCPIIKFDKGLYKIISKDIG